MPWPLDAEGVRKFASGLDEILVVEEKRQLIEYQLKEQLYNWREDVRPRVVGKYDDKGEWELPMHDWQLPAAGELTPSGIARVDRPAHRALPHQPAHHGAPAISSPPRRRELAQPHAGMLRVPHLLLRLPAQHFHPCAGRQPRARGHRLPLHGDLARSARRRPFPQMGGEGVAWVGQAPFTKTKHVFANLGDGTYTHSGILAIRQALAAKVPITYKISTTTRWQ